MKIIRKNIYLSLSNWAPLRRAGGISESENLRLPQYLNGTLSMLVLFFIAMQYHGKPLGYR